MNRTIVSVCLLFAVWSSISFGQLNLHPQVNNSDNASFNSDLVNQDGQPATIQMPVIYPEATKIAPKWKEGDEAPLGSSLISMEEIQKKMAYFDLVIVANAASTGQWIQVYKKVTGADGRPTIQTLWPTRHFMSSGDEDYSCTDEDGGAKSRLTYRQTPSGYFMVSGLYVDKFSGEYADAWMPYAVFITDDKGTSFGIATHRATDGSEMLLLGNRESHGCMRLTKADAQQIFQEVSLTGGPIHRDEVDSNGYPRYHATLCPGSAGHPCQGGEEGQAKREIEYQSFLNKIPASPYDRMQAIPVVNRETGDIPMKPDPSNPTGPQIPQRSVYGYKTLYIIQKYETNRPRDYIVAAKITADHPNAKYTLLTQNSNKTGEPESVDAYGLQTTARVCRPKHPRVSESPPDSDSPYAEGGYPQQNSPQPQMANPFQPFVDGFNKLFHPGN